VLGDRQFGGDLPIRQARCDESEYLLLPLADREVSRRSDPGQRVDALLTNFHLPRSTLLALVMAFAGVEKTRGLYRLAIEERYRFYSFGDAMLLL